MRSAKGSITHPVYLYLDEAGDLDFKSNGSKWFMVTCVISHKPYDNACILMKERHRLLEDKRNFRGYFHACEDWKETRDAVFRIISEHLADFSVYSCKALKSQFADMENAPRFLYRAIFDNLLQHISHSRGFDEASCVIAITDEIPVAAKKNNLKGQLKIAMQATLPDGVPFSLIHLHSQGDYNLQIADYFSWARFRFDERGDGSYYSLVGDAWEGDGDVIRTKG